MRERITRRRRRHHLLRSQIFWWFGATIVVAGLASWAVANVAAGGPSSWRRDMEGMKRFGANRFAEVWDRPDARRALAREVAEEFDAAVTVLDRDDTVLERVGDACHGPSVTLKPRARGAPLGTVELCRDTNRGFLSSVLGLLVALGVLWAVSHKIAKRLGRPLEALVRATADIGRGRYKVELNLHPHAPLEIHRLTDAIRDMATKIERQMADQRELLASVSHEVRSPLARIRLLLELLRDDGQRADAREKLYRELEHEIEEIDDLVGGLLASSRVDFSALTLRPLDLVGAAERAMARAALPSAPRVIGSPREIRCDATLIARTLANLLDNAVKHGGGVQEVVLSFEDTRAALEVHDGGPGFADGEADRAFDPFYGKPKGAHDSLGLGLALVQRIARAHGGDAYAKNRPGGGAIVGLWLPSDAGSEGEPPTSE